MILLDIIFIGPARILTVEAQKPIKLNWFQRLVVKLFIRDFYEKLPKRNYQGLWCSRVDLCTHESSEVQRLTGDHGKECKYLYDAYKQARLKELTAKIFYCLENKVKVEWKIIDRQFFDEEYYEINI